MTLEAISASPWITCPVGWKIPGVDLLSKTKHDLFNWLNLSRPQEVISCSLSAVAWVLI